MRIVPFLALGLALLLGACGRDPAAEQNDLPTFRILAGSELKDMEPLLKEFGQANQVNIKLEYSGTLDAVDTLQGGTNHDAAWVSHGKYLQLVPAVKQQIVQSEKTMYSRVVLGLKPEAATRLGWSSGQVGWREVIAASEAGKFRFAMTNPTGSNTGFVALVGLAAELSGKGDALRVEDVPTRKLTALFKGQSLSSGSSGDLADRWLASPELADGMVNYESVIRGMAARGLPLTVIVPREGVITADYPLILLKKSQQAPLYQKLVAWLRQPDTQKRIAEQTRRAPLAGSDDDQVVNELPFPASQAVVDAILRGFLDEYAKPISTYLIYDHSGSMRGDRIQAARQAIIALTGSDGTASGRFATLRAREKLTLAPFSSGPDPLQEFVLGEDSKANAQLLQQVAAAVGQIDADGGTAIYDTLAGIYPQALAEKKQERRNVAIILLTDGKNTEGRDFEDFAGQVQVSSNTRVPIFPIIFGDADAAEMQQLAKMTGGQTFDARTTPLVQVLKKIRTYQ
ncbi:VWA domain-containing protein [Chitinimonas arctica]|uniref:VWA domain-containing protein n=1 Tax=Chitinimonas arctica TaxID=2594795 RepID=A0A516SGH9_9NEIS|nr:VWA domain-containing protein [Chitinimonas arctica]QDQ27128.1 VWA domain-containing protein [Chitinimonas arctica]